MATTVAVLSAKNIPWHVGSWLRIDHYSVLDIMVQILIFVKQL